MEAKRVCYSFNTELTEGGSLGPTASLHARTNCHHTPWDILKAYTDFISVTEHHNSFFPSCLGSIRNFHPMPYMIQILYSD